MTVVPLLWCSGCGVITVVFLGVRVRGSETEGGQAGLKVRVSNGADPRFCSDVVGSETEISLLWLRAW